MVARFQIVPASQLASSTVPTRWVWPGLIATGHVTLFIGEWKAGKTTLLSFVIARFRDGGTVAGRPVLPASALIVSEEPQPLWNERHTRLNFPETVQFLCQPFPNRPTIGEWKDLIEHIAGLDRAPDVVVLDPLAMFLPGHAESHPPAMLDALAPLRRLTGRGCAVVLLHHPSKHAGLNLLGRGTAALHGFVDIDARLHLVRDARSDRVRRITVKSRTFGFNTDFTVEMTEDGRDYAVLPRGPVLGSWKDGVSLAQAILEAAGQPLTAVDLWRGWPEDYPQPAMVTLRHWLWMAQSDGLLDRFGSGRRNDAYRYWMTGEDLPAPRPDPFEVLAAAERKMREEGGEE